MTYSKQRDKNTHIREMRKLKIGPLFIGYCDYGMAWGIILELPGFLRKRYEKKIPHWNKPPQEEMTEQKASPDPV